MKTQPVALRTAVGRASYWDDAMLQDIGRTMSVPFDLLLGRRTYEIFAAHWPYIGDEDSVARALNNATKHVASRTLTEVTWKNVRLIKGHGAAAVARLKAVDGPELQVHGRSGLIQTLPSARSDR